MWDVQFGFGSVWASVRNANGLWRIDPDPAEVIENLTAMMLERREIKPDSGGPGRFRGGCGQYTTFRTTSGLPWSMAGMRDRTTFRAKGDLGGTDGPGRRPGGWGWAS